MASWLRSAPAAAQSWSSKATRARAPRRWSGAGRRRCGQSARARLRALDAGAAHDGAHLAVRVLAGDGPQERFRAAGASLGASQAVDEFVGVDQVFRDRNGPPGGSTALQRRDPDLARLEVDVAGPGRERLAHPASGQREGLDRGRRVGPDRGEEALALCGGEVLAAAGVDQAEGALGHDTGKLHYS